MKGKELIRQGNMEQDEEEREKGRRGRGGRQEGAESGKGKLNKEQLIKPESR